MLFNRQAHRQYPSLQLKREKNCTKYLRFKNFDSSPYFSFSLITLCFFQSAAASRSLCLSFFSLISWFKRNKLIKTLNFAKTLVNTVWGNHEWCYTPKFYFHFFCFIVIIIDWFVTPAKFTIINVYCQKAKNISDGILVCPIKLMRFKMRKWFFRRNGFLFKKVAV